MPDISKVGPADYSSNETPKGYVCSDCGASGVRLFREYQTFLIHSSLNCTECALKYYKKSHDGKDFIPERPGDAYAIGWMVYAAPTEEGGGYWGYCGAPPQAIKWWDNLPEKKS